MDEIVKLAIKKWPNVPACYGWLGLDARGDWYMRDEETQTKGAFTESKGTRLVHRKLIEFINRNYQQDSLGRYYFQNGPQKVYVELEVTPWVYRFNHNNQIVTQTEIVADVLQTYIDELGRAYIDTNLGIGLVHTMDMYAFTIQMDEQGWQLKDLTVDSLENFFGFIKSPAKDKASH